jgi:DNA-binding CsgD family transcriptional regulator
MRQTYESLVESIYDCATDPSLWPQALDSIRDAVDAAYAEIDIADHDVTGTDRTTRRLTSRSLCSVPHPHDINTMITAMPDDWAMRKLPEDVSWSPLSHMREGEFRKTDFYQQFLRPYHLRDVLGVNSIKRKDLRGRVVMPTAAHREPVTEKNRALASSLSPHIRRAITINDLSNNSVLAMSLYRQVLDTLSVAVFIVGQGHRVMFTNARGDALLSKGEMVFTQCGLLKTHRSNVLDSAICRSLAYQLPDCNSSFGVPLVGKDGELGAAYVVRLSHQSPGMSCCAVFVTQRGEQSAMAVDVLRGLFNLTVAEARIALLVAHGEAPLRIALSLGVAINTVRTHLKHIYAKLDVSDQAGLAGLVSGLLPPVK